MKYTRLWNVNDTLEKSTYLEGVTITTLCYRPLQVRRLLESMSRTLPSRFLVNQIGQ